MTEYHEPYELIPAETRDCHRALKSLQEELEAVDWYNQRVSQCSDPALRDVLAHNRDEEMEHACMVLEWLRRNMDGWDANLRTYLFSELPITKIEAAKDAESGGAEGSHGGSIAVPRVTIGSLRAEPPPA